VVVIAVLLLLVVAVVSGGSMRRRGALSGAQYAGLLAAFVALAAAVLALRMAARH
jgi:hypothetical protein